MRDNGFARAQASYEAQRPPEYDVPECPICGSLLDDNKCADDYENGCDWEAPEPDYEMEDNCD